MYQEHPNRSLYDKVMTLRIWSKNRGLQQRRNVAETEHPDVATLLHDVATFGVSFGWIFSPFLAHNGGFLSSNPKEMKGRRRGLGEGDFVHTLGPRRRLGAVFEDLGEDHEICGRKSETHHHLIIIVSSSSFLMFYPKFMMYQTSIML